jgi:hypothetical protein
VSYIIFYPDTRRARGGNSLGSLVCGVKRGINLGGAQLEFLVYNFYFLLDVASRYRGLYPDEDRDRTFDADSRWIYCHDEDCNRWQESTEYWISFGGAVGVAIIKRRGKPEVGDENYNYAGETIITRGKIISHEGGIIITRVYRDMRGEFSAQAVIREAARIFAAFHGISRGRSLVFVGSTPKIGHLQGEVSFFGEGREGRKEVDGSRFVGCPPSGPGRVLGLRKWLAHVSHSHSHPRKRPREDV